MVGRVGRLPDIVSGRETAGRPRDCEPAASAPAGAPSPLLTAYPPSPSAVVRGAQGHRAARAGLRFGRSRESTRYEAAKTTVASATIAVAV
jgi:hypothetical protein